MPTAARREETRNRDERWRKWPVEAASGLNDWLGRRINMSLACDPKSELEEAVECEGERTRHQRLYQLAEMAMKSATVEATGLIRVVLPASKERRGLPIQSKAKGISCDTSEDVENVWLGSGLTCGVNRRCSQTDGGRRREIRMHEGGSGKWLQRPG
jgi:hypothetical protein